MSVIRPSTAGSPGQAQWDLPGLRAMRVEKSGIVFSDRLSLDAWEIVGRRLMSYTDSVSWWIADWLVYGESQFKDRYEEAIRRTSLNYQTLRNYTWVARRFDLSRRRDNLSVGHHAEVAALDLPEQEFWLRKAETYGWSRNQLRSAVRASRQERLGQPDGGEPDIAEENEPVPGAEPGGRESVDSAPAVPESLYLHFTSDQFAQCEAAAVSSGLSIDRWARRVLVAAAAQMERPSIDSRR